MQKRTTSNVNSGSRNSKGFSFQKTKSLLLAVAYKCSQEQTALLYLMVCSVLFQEQHSQLDAFFSANVKGRSQQELKDTASQKTNRYCQSCYHLQPSLCKIAAFGSCRAQESAVSTSWIAFPKASACAVTPSSWCHVNPVSQHYLSTSAAFSISVLACLCQLRFSFQETFKLFEVHYPYLFYWGFQLIQVVTIIAVFPINFLPLDSQSIPRY